MFMFIHFNRLDPAFFRNLSWNQMFPKRDHTDLNG